ncbi:MAG: DUF4169 family protein [Alphaproteobacteria bacterium]|nr:DUF4169 family protein [Alphaproteobacteria bacterium]
MGELVNLRQARMQKNRMKKRLQSTENAAKFGRNKQQQTRDAEPTERVTRLLDQTKLDRDD